jgi:hypothetical protein
LSSRASKVRKHGSSNRQSTPFRSSSYASMRR